MSLAKLLTAVTAEFEDKKDTSSASDVLAFLDKYVNTEKKEYTDNKENNALTFGKYKGHTVEDLSKNDKGRDYLQWMLAQSWAEKFPDIVAKCTELKINKKVKSFLI